MSALHRFFVGSEAVAAGRARLGGDQARQIADVLRLSVGDHVVLVRDGQEMEVRLDAIGPSSVQGVVVERRPARGEPRIRLTLALPLLRGDRSEEVIEAVTQLGVSRIVPFTSERSVVRELSPAKRARWERIARESAETARRGMVPDIGPLVTWNELFDVLEPPVVVAWEGEKERPLRKAIPLNSLVASVVIGPEGGLSEDEIAVATEQEAHVVSLGPRNLRSETAAVAAVAQILAILET
ncbi:MAG: 16S rRNA (uracil(1498)-N(3))-methyltransferase [Chloroflexi bacterium]|nr:16S rRNA (uracil(1498)-N(3))-methyltransferase [Chloroflexota bacterium]